MYGRGRSEIGREQDEALAALLRPGAGRAGRGGTALYPGDAQGMRAAPLTGAKAGRSSAPSWLPWLALFGGTAIGIGCILSGLWIAPILLRAIWPAANIGAALSDAAFNLTIFVPMFALALVGGWSTGINPLRIGASPFAMLGLGMVVGGCGVALAASYAGVAGVARIGSGAQASTLVLVGSLLMLLQSGTEEVLLRGWMQPACSVRWGPWPAILLTAIVFAGLHVLGGARSPVSLVNLTIGGIMFGLLRWKTGGMVAPIAAHFVWNWAEALLLGLDPNPGVGSFGALIDLDLIGPAIWGGSDEGLNASIAMMAVLIAIVVPLALWRRRTTE